MVNGIYKRFDMLVDIEVVENRKVVLLILCWNVVIDVGDREGGLWEFGG